MPELPEVEFCVRRLTDWLIGESITSVEASEGAPLRKTTPGELSTALSGHRITGIERRGKQMLWTTDGLHRVLVHLGMTGKWVRLSDQKSERRWIRICLRLESGDSLLYIDPRKLGRIEVVSPALLSQHNSWHGLGPDALEICGHPDQLAEAFRGTKRQIKVALLDQKRVAGLGNIYVAEGLFDAGISPFRSAQSLSVKEWGRLGKALLKALEASIKRETNPEIDYVTAGKSKNPFMVFRREGEPCPRCKTTIERITQGGRSTFLCRQCQSVRLDDLQV